MLKKNLLLFLLLISATPLIYSQTFNYYQSKYYNLATPFSGSENRYLGEKLDALALYFNSYFHFDLNSFATSDKKFNIQIYANKEAFLKAFKDIPQSSNSFYFLQYNNNNEDKLVGYVDESKNFNQVFQHYLFIQFLRTFIYAPPLWIEKGFALYFEKSKYNKSKKEYIHKNNYTWLETLKKITSPNYLSSDNHLIKLDLFLTMDNKMAQKRLQSFYAQSWGFVNFLLNAPNPIYHRIIWDSIRSLNPTATKEENNTICIEAFNWVNKNLFYKDFYEFNQTLSSYPQLINKAIENFNQKKYNEAKKLFLLALTLDDENYIIYYYLGLICYNQKDYQMANYYYLCAIEQNKEAAVCYYGLGLSNFYLNQYQESSLYLNKAIKLNENFRELAKDILDIIE